MLASVLMLVPTTVDPWTQLLLANVRTNAVLVGFQDNPIEAF